MPRLSTRLNLSALCILLLSGCSSDISTTEDASLITQGDVQRSADIESSLDALPPQEEDASASAGEPASEDASSLDDISTPQGESDAQSESLDDDVQATPQGDTSGEDKGDANESSSDDALFPSDTLPEEDMDTNANASQGDAPDLETIEDDADEGLDIAAEDTDSPDTTGDPTSACMTEHITLTQANPEQYEFYELCVAAEGATEDALKAIDPSIYCGISGIFAQCQSTKELGCHGDLTYADPGLKTISESGWSTLCELSLQEGVRIIAGGYWL